MAESEILLSIIIPVYNEEKTLPEILERVLSIQWEFEVEIIVVDDGSTDDSSKILKSFKDQFIILKHDTNLGKGACIKSSLEVCVGEFIIIQDADLEYYPEEIPKLVDVALSGPFDVVFGSRFKNLIDKSSMYRSFYLGNLFLTWLTNMVTGKHLTDMETCFKLVRRKVVKNIKLFENGFGIEPEMTCKLAKIASLKWEEIPIKYHARSVQEGKKIKWSDGFKAVFIILKTSYLED